jgi:hypothetical protein
MDAMLDITRAVFLGVYQILSLDQIVLGDEGRRGGLEGKKNARSARF